MSLVEMPEPARDSRLRKGKEPEAMGAEHGYATSRPLEKVPASRLRYTNPSQPAAHSSSDSSHSERGYLPVTQSLGWAEAPHNLRVETSSVVGRYSSVAKEAIFPPVSNSSSTRSMRGPSISGQPHHPGCEPALPPILKESGSHQQQQHHHHRCGPQVLPPLHEYHSSPEQQASTDSQQGYILLGPRQQQPYDTQPVTVQGASLGPIRAPKLLRIRFSPLSSALRPEQPEVAGVVAGQVPVSPTLSASQNDREVTPFVYALWSVVNDEGNRRWIQWNMDGSRFRVKNANNLLTAMQCYGLKAKKKDSLNKNLTEYGFHRISDGRRDGKLEDFWHEFIHPLFQRDRVDLLPGIIRRQRSNPSKSDQNRFGNWSDYPSTSN
ncbi:Heat shock transcription factor [Mycoemilia scoparia]|uniref:Heat shock transcription factor n=1 Tax=Mycoemilia scoparia TaxID=417184 RepID=A0A9W7ZXT1_9FUNG|nr:Heat shock transcription factor [Mycoemilia scoparia]